MDDDQYEYTAKPEPLPDEAQRQKPAEPGPERPETFEFKDWAQI